MEFVREFLRGTLDAAGGVVETEPSGDLHVLLAAGVVIAEPAVVGEVDDRVSPLAASVPNHAPTDAGHRVFEADGRGEGVGRRARGTRRLRQLDEVDVGVCIEVERHAASAEVEQSLLQPGPARDVGHGLAERREEALVVALIGRLAVDEIG